LSRIENKKRKRGIKNKNHIIFVMQKYFCIKIHSILSYGQFLVTDTPWSQGVRMKEVPLYRKFLTNRMDQIRTEKQVVKYNLFALMHNVLTSHEPLLDMTYRKSLIF